MSKRFLSLSLALCLFSISQPILATQRTQEVVKSIGTIKVDEELLKLLITSLLGKGGLEEAYSISKKAIELFPKSAYWLDLHAKICLWTGRNQEAFETYSKLANLRPSKDSIKNLFLMALATNRFDVASQLIKKYEYLREDRSIKDLVYIFEQAGELKELIRLLEGLYEKKRDTSILYSLAQISYNYGDVEKAFEYMKRLEKEHGITSSEQASLYSNILFTMRRYEKALFVLKKYVKLAKDEDIEYFENLSDLAWPLKDIETAFYASQRLESLGKARLVDYIRLYMVLYSRKKYQEASIYAKRGYEKYKDLYLLSAYVQSLANIERWEEIVSFLSKKEEEVLKSSYLSGLYFRALYKVGKRDYATSFLKTALKNRFSEDLLAQAIYSAIEGSDRNLAIYIENNFKQFKDRMPKEFASLYTFLQNAKSALDLLRDMKRESLEDLLTYSDVLALYGREEEASQIRFSLFKKLSQDMEDTYKDPNKLYAYLRVGIYYMSASQIDQVLRIAKDSLSKVAYEDIYQTYLISQDQQDKLSYMANIEKKELKPWMQLNIALNYDDRDKQKELLEKYVDILPIRDRVEALRRTGQLKEAGAYAFKGLEENREDYLLYKQFRDLAREHYSLFEDELSYVNFGDVFFLRNYINLRHYMAKGIYLLYDSDSWLRLSNKNASIKRTENTLFNRIKLRKVFDKSYVEAGFSYLSSLRGVGGFSLGYGTYLSNRTSLQASLDVNQPSYESIYMLQGGMKDSFSLSIQHGLSSRLFLSMKSSYESYKSQDYKHVGTGFINYGEVYYKLRVGYPDYTLRAFIQGNMYREKERTKGVIDEMVFVPSPDVLPESYGLLGVGFSFGFDNKDNYVRVVRPFLDVSLSLDTRKRLGFNLLVGIGGTILRQDNLSFGLSYTTNFMGSRNNLWGSFIKYLRLY